MKVLTYDKYGLPDNCYFEEKQLGKPQEGQVLVKVHATSLNAADFDQLTGNFFGRLFGPFKPKYKVLGSDIAGCIEAVGPGVSLQVGDRVMADLTDLGFGAFSEYVLVKASELTRIPDTMTDVQAAALPSAGVMAIQAMNFSRGTRVLIAGAGGGMGSYAIKVMKMKGFYVTGVDAQEKLSVIKDMGADRVLDYKTCDYTQLNETYDFIIDCHATKSVKDYRRVLSDKAYYTMIGGRVSSMFNLLLFGDTFSKKDKSKVTILLGRANDKDSMKQLVDLYVDHGIIPLVDRVYDFKDIKEAMKYFMKGQFVGKIVIKMT